MKQFDNPAVLISNFARISSIIKLGTASFADIFPSVSFVFAYGIIRWTAVTIIGESRLLDECQCRIQANHVGVCEEVHDAGCIAELALVESKHVKLTRMKI